jgi:site-specific recombinase XerC
VWEAPVVEPTPLDQLLHGYERYLVQERALMPATVQRYRDKARKLLARCFEDGPLQIGRMTPAAISSYIVGESRRWSIGTVKHSVTALRSLLRYLLLRGEIAVDLAAAVPAVAGYRLSGLPKTLTDGDVERVSGAGRRTPAGRWRSSSLPDTRRPAVGLPEQPLIMPRHG